MLVPSSPSIGIELRPVTYMSSLSFCGPNQEDSSVLGGMSDATEGPSGRLPLMVSLVANRNPATYRAQRWLKDKTVQPSVTNSTARFVDGHFGKEESGGWETI